MPVFGDDPDGVGLEGHGHGRSVKSVGSFDHFVEQGLVADMHAIKITYCNYCGFKLFGD
ncbi:hypothetical protein JCM12296A_53070 [Desulfosarcina cetonica]